MINAGFEEFNPDDDGLVNLSPAGEVCEGTYDDVECHSLEFAVGWHRIANSPDVIQPINVYPPIDMAADGGICSISGTPRSGVGAGRFGMDGGSSEFGYGTTDSLTAGVTYEISFWVRKDFYDQPNMQFGLAVSENMPAYSESDFTFGVQPLITIIPTSTQYVKASACYEAQTNGTHYILLGPFGGIGSDLVVYIVDDVSVVPLDPTIELPEAEVTIPQLEYCVGDDVIVTGNQTINETSYTWNIYALVNGNPSILKYSSGEINGQVADFNASDALGWMISPGNCYRVELIAYGTCSDKAYVDFCYDDPTFDIIYDESSVCENIPIEVHTDGDPTWMYNWSDGQNGIGLNSAIHTPNSAEPVLTIIATTPLGCEHSETLWLNIHSQDNQAPWMDGTWGSGNYTTYVNQGDIAYIYSSLYNDHSNEEISYEISDNLPSNYQLINLPPPSPPTDGGPFMIEWQTNSNTPPGSYFINLHSEDNNACESLPSDHTFHIQVICDHCPKCINYNEVSTPGNNPLPPETKAGRCIVAGYTAPVETGNADVLFQAGQYIQLGSKFSAGTGFQANIDETTCIDDCEDCCDDFSGFTHDYIPNVFTPNGDGINDYWYVPDIDNPYCAFNAQGYELDITNDYGQTVRSDAHFADDCCSYAAPSPSNNLLVSSIYWDGNKPNGNPVNECEYYFYVLTLYGCNYEETYHGNIFLVRTSCNGMITNPNGETPRDALSQEHFENLDLDQIQELEERITLFPNPANESLTIQGIPMPVMVNILDTKGKTLLHEESSMGQIDLLNLASGVYFVQIYIGNRSIMKEFIKQ